MLNMPINTLTALAPELRICTICDGPGPLPQLSAYLAELQPEISRKDLALSDALQALRTHQGQGFERIILAPDWQKQRAPHLLHAVIEAAQPLAAQLILLAPADGPADLTALADLPGLTLLRGPPFLPPVADTDEPPPKAAPGFLARIFARSRHPPMEKPPAPPPRKNPRIIAIQPLVGGAGATLLATTLAQEIARLPGKPRIVILDLDLQFGSVATYLDLPAEPRIDDAYRNFSAMDAEAFQSCLQSAGDQIRLFAAPTEILPLDGLTAGDATRLVTLAAETADLVLIDLPHAITDWSGPLFALADLVIGVTLADVRSARNSARLRMLLQAEPLPPGRISHVVNRVPPRQTTTTRAEMNEFTRGIGSAPLALIPDGGPALAQACNSGQPLFRAAPGNPARLAIRTLAETLMHAAVAQTLAEGGQ